MINSITVGNKELLEESEHNFFEISDIRGGVNAISSAIFNTYACPQKQINFIFDPLESEHAFFVTPINKTLGVPKLIQA
ncbi:hypothetical protein [Emticicia sp. C21]|uniref:hypothetical protein n=1 Tax=Emticicia sp. C21 TaxID=2302915 RepID=UPI000E356EF2|nr:hypothetical protein [Emticicia sp. C21]RFS13311.1 hypothetical protein D0T08_27085 [Emticicia sp. C21]